MKKNGFEYIFIGMFFILINIPIGNVDILPDFIGFIFFALGYEKLKDSSMYFSRVRKFVWLLIAISFVLFYRSAFMQVPAIDMDNILPQLMLAVITAVFTLINFYNLFYGIKELADKNKQNDIAVEAEKRWKQIIILNISTVFLLVVLFIPILNIVYALALVVFSIYVTIKMMKLIKKCSRSF